MAKGQQHSPAVVVVILVAVVAGLGVWLWRNREPAPVSRLALTPASFAALPGWRESDARGALAAFRRSCTTFANEPPDHVLGGVGYAGTVADWNRVCTAAPGGDSSRVVARRYFEAWFSPIAVAAGADANALFTGYYEPEIHGSRRRHGAYTTPVYGTPGDLISVDLGLFRDNLKGEHVTGRVLRHALVPYFSRAQIDANGLPAAPILFYADDPVQVFFLHIQGSGRVRFENGNTVRVAYAGQNGRPYTPVGRILIEQGAIGRDRMSMQAIRAWMQVHPDAARRVMEQDQSFVFFREEPLGDPSLGSPGSEGVPLTPEASSAVDAHVHPLGVPFYVAATMPDADPSRSDRALDRLFIAQDTGGAIKRAARVDLFWGFGPRAESIAGRLKSTGQLFVLLPKPVAARLSSHTAYGAP